MTEKVARGLHQRFDEQIAILKEIASSQKEMLSSQKEMASSQKETSSKMISILERIDSKLGGNPNLAADR